MRKAAVALLAGAYVFMALSVAALFWRAGLSWALDVCGFLSTLALCLTTQNLVGRRLDAVVVQQDLETLRQAHRILVDHVESTQAAMEALSQAVHSETAERTEAIVSEVRLLEGLVARMGETLQARLAPSAVDAYARADPRAAPHGERHIDHQRAALLDTVREALADNRIDLYLQPVVGLPQRRTAFYESFSRLRDDTGRVMMPAEYLSVAEPEGLISAIDNLLLFRCVQIVRRLAKQDRRIGIFCNISLSSLGDEQFFPQFLEFMAQNKDLASALIFELGQVSFRERGGVAARNMARLADLGFRFSIDKVADVDLDFADFARADVKFVKIAARVLLEELLQGRDGVEVAGVRGLHAGDFAALTRRYGVEVIAEKVETEREVIDILELDIAYGQGNLFGEPRAIREAVLSEAEPPGEVMRGALRRSVGR